MTTPAPTGAATPTPTAATGPASGRRPRNSAGAPPWMPPFRIGAGSIPGVNLDARDLIAVTGPWGDAGNAEATQASGAAAATTPPTGVSASGPSDTSGTGSGVSGAGTPPTPTPTPLRRNHHAKAATVPSGASALPGAVTSGPSLAHGPTAAQLAQLAKDSDAELQQWAATAGGFGPAAPTTNTPTTSKAVQ